MSKDNGGPAGDRELLEMAAKAIHTTENYANKAYMEGWFSWWNPLQRDTDALNLAVSIPGLNLQWIIAEAWQAHDTHEKRMEYVRRAIVRAAAAIGAGLAPFPTADEIRENWT